MRLLHKGESLCCFRDLTSVTYGGLLPSDLTLSALRFILSATSEQSCKQDLETVDVCNSLSIFFVFLLLFQRICEICRKIRLTKVPRDLRKSSERFQKKFREISENVPRDFIKKYREIFWKVWDHLHGTSFPCLPWERVFLQWTWLLTLVHVLLLVCFCRISSNWEGALCSRLFCQTLLFYRQAPCWIAQQAHSTIHTQRDFLQRHWWQTNTKCQDAAKQQTWEKFGL